MSLSRHSETIVAPITALGGAVAVVRLSGHQAWKISSAVFTDWPKEVLARRVLYGQFVTGDDGLVLPFEEGRSYTGEQSVEMSVHGSPASVRALVELCLAAGARQAEPGEFTLRAFMNGRMDLTQAEGVRDTVNASTESQLRQANLLREGVLRDSVRTVRSRLESVLAAVEASTDFSEEVGELDRVDACLKCTLASDAIDALLAQEESSRLIREGATVVIAGRPNAGKSSLLNILLGSDRAIVTDVPGTTRDTIEESVSLGGVHLRLVDTAGLRDSDDSVERLGIDRTREAVANADFVIYLYDASVGWQSADQDFFCSLDQPSLVVANKCDLSGAIRGLSISCTTGEGVGELTTAIRGLVDVFSRDSGLINRRHAALLRATKDSIARARDTLRSDAPHDLAAVDLQASIRALGEITGETTPIDVIDRIFHEFCIGK